VKKVLLELQQKAGDGITGAVVAVVSEIFDVEIGFCDTVGNVDFGIVADDSVVVADAVETAEVVVVVEDVDVAVVGGFKFVGVILVGAVGIDPVDDV
jgi:hypothetical protein